jgi:hypothetical protein
MKKIGIVLAALVIATFMVGTVAAMPPITKPQQEQYFTEHSSVQGSGFISISKKVLDKTIAIDVVETLDGFTGWDNETRTFVGTFAMQTTEKLNESADNSTPTGDSTEPWLTENYYSKTMIQFEAKGRQMPSVATLPGLESDATYTSPSFHDGTGASVRERFNVDRIQKDETVMIKTTSDADVGLRQTLSFDTKDDFSGMWRTDSQWKKVCEKDIEHSQYFFGNFQLAKDLGRNKSRPFLFFYF